MLKKFGLFCLGLLLTLSILRVFTPVQASVNLESRISRLESENLQLRSQVSQLQSQISRLGRLEPLAPQAPYQAPPQAYPSQPPTDSRFDRLATLAVELKQQLIQLEARLTKVEKQIAR